MLIDLSIEMENGEFDNDLATFEQDLADLLGEPKPESCF